MAMNCFNLIEISSVGHEVIDEDKEIVDTELKNFFPAFKIELEKQMNAIEDLSPILLAIEMQVVIIRIRQPSRRLLSGLYPGDTAGQHMLCPGTDNKPGDHTGYQGGEEGGGGVGGPPEVG